MDAIREAIGPLNLVEAVEACIQLADQFLAEISSLEANNNVLWVGTSNHPNSIDPRILRGGRFSEKIQIGLPTTANRILLISHYLNGVRLDPSLAVAAIQAIFIAAKRMAFNRSPHADQPSPLNRSDSEKALGRVRGGW